MASAIKPLIRVHLKPGSRFNELYMDPQHCSVRKVGFRDFRFYELFIDDAALSLKQNQCCGSMTFWCGSGPGSADLCLWHMDPDPAIFVIDLHSRRQHKTNFFLFKFFCLLLFEGTFTSFFEDKKSTRSYKTVGIKVFLTVVA